MTTVFIVEQLLTVASVVRIFVGEETIADEYTMDSQFSSSTVMVSGRDIETEAMSVPSCATYFVTDEILISW